MISNFRLMEYLSINLSIYWYIHLCIYFWSIWRLCEANITISADYGRQTVQNVWDNNFLFSNSWSTTSNWWNIFLLTYLSIDISIYTSISFRKSRLKIENIDPFLPRTVRMLEIITFCSQINDLRHQIDGISIY